MEYDVVVIGGGHAGVEASIASARMGCATLLITGNVDYLGEMSCNPSVGGVAKGTIVREIDALGGVMGRIADAAGIQFRVLNKSKGIAVHGLRAQVDRFRYRDLVREAVLACDGLSLLQDMVVDLAPEGSSWRLSTECGTTVVAKRCVFTVGTFLEGCAHIGAQTVSCGRMGERASTGLAHRLEQLGLRAGRLKTGTPARVHRDSIDYSALTPQRGDTTPVPFSYATNKPLTNDALCWELRTNSKTHEIIRNNLHRSPVYGLQSVQGVGPRYCPSIEDKLVRFGDRSGHGLFLEPEGNGRPEMYVSGFSTGLPVAVQEQMLRSLSGFSQARMIKPAYAIEYVYFCPNQLNRTLESRVLPGVYFAGQINGTSGYEEAAGQGLLAGINAAQAVRGKEPLVLRRDEAYLGVLVDDLVVKGTEEPYRMFTSRAEYRLLLRYDTCDERLMPLGVAVGLVSSEVYASRQAVWAEKEKLRTLLDSTTVGADAAASHTGVSITQGVRASVFLRRPEVSLLPVLAACGLCSSQYSSEVRAGVEADIKYAGFVKKHLEEIARNQRMETMCIPADISYADITGLLTESREKLSQVQPQTIGQASRVPGVTPADVSVLIMYITQLNKQ
ncbi:tRNA uridine-5-carboxymethylaminomethyl(34) synthesis enzyme MnmG [Chitinivibrio alkaliphilus]|uniref:tRNA uridine 5-carboxymethylaminomethyl modification enzyme MnmG n=1 Tax=Chitinivibrio alkaliphilus ACht1 TaxID=1313304 RepID=U7D9N2_9BACT|nr:tRNA uridine-5-carboxymethylaminomethyl(34) synthesis enzyme MnmG [Chitinivibrio alkaliphilus]ERP31125.1 tRNA uridine 5-carboxymethylaminomethyl modification enzyme GidA [Chitinivibrio alkaliphilus ACht1]